jgi:hypothetical protein
MRQCRGGRRKDRQWRKSSLFGDSWRSSEETENMSKREWEDGSEWEED